MRVNWVPVDELACWRILASIRDTALIYSELELYV